MGRWARMRGEVGLRAAWGGPVYATRSTRPGRKTRRTSRCAASSGPIFLRYWSSEPLPEPQPDGARLIRHGMDVDGAAGQGVALRGTIDYREPVECVRYVHLRRHVLERHAGGK